MIIYYSFVIIIFQCFNYYALITQSELGYITVLSFLQVLIKEKYSNKQRNQSYIFFASVSWYKVKVKSINFDSNLIFVIVGDQNLVEIQDWILCFVKLVIKYVLLHFMVDNSMHLKSVLVLSNSGITAKLVALNVASL